MGVVDQKRKIKQTRVAVNENENGYIFE